MTPADDQITATMRWEGKVVKDGLHVPYKDVLGNWTQGYGHLLKDANSPPWTEERARQQLVIDLMNAQDHALMLCPFLDQHPNPFKAFTDLVFNVGYAKVKEQGTQTIMAFHKADWPRAKSMFLMWDKGTDSHGNRVVVPALARRREEAADLWLTGVEKPA